MSREHETTGSLPTSFVKPVPVAHRRSETHRHRMWGSGSLLLCLKRWDQSSVHVSFLWHQLGGVTVISIWV